MKSQKRKELELNGLLHGFHVYYVHWIEMEESPEKTYKINDRWYDSGRRQYFIHTGLTRTEVFWLDHKIPEWRTVTSRQFFNPKYKLKPIFK